MKFSYEFCCSREKQEKNENERSFVCSFVRLKCAEREKEKEEKETNERTNMNSSDDRPLPVDGRRPLKQKKWK